MDEKLKKHGSISWSELITSDPAAAKKFYGEMFGWQFDDMQMETGIYSVVTANDDEVAGIMAFAPDTPPMPPTWGLYITVDNVDQSSEKAVSLGAKVVLPPMDIPEVGRFCALQDPQGAHINIISYIK
jgi:predicted enzyme related to lactoylglutathione lyase